MHENVKGKNCGESKKAEIDIWFCKIHDHLEWRQIKNSSLNIIFVPKTFKNAGNKTYSVTLI